MALYKVPEHVGKVRVWLDDVEITRDCFEVDTVTNEASVYLRDDEGRHYTIRSIIRDSDGNVAVQKIMARKRLKGTIRIALPE